MGCKAAIHRLSLQVSDLDRGYFRGHELTVARHPSETERRMMLRILLFAMHAHERLAFTRGVSTVDEPDLWQHDLAGDIECWIELGQPDGKRIRHALGRARRVFVYTTGGQAADVWWDRQGGRFMTLKRLAVTAIGEADADALAALCARNMSLQCVIQDGEIWIGDSRRDVRILPAVRKPMGDAAS